MIDFKGAIFDLDGTLFDSMPVWENVAIDYLKSRGIEPDASVREAVRAMSIQQACRLFCLEYGLSATEAEVIDGVNALIWDFYFHKVTLKPGVLAALEHLKSRGVRMCIATATDRPLVSGGLQRTGIAPFFDAVFTCTEAGAGKDRPDIFLQALDFLGTGLESTMVFEDALYAVRTAKAAGFRVTALYDAAADHQQAEIRRLAEAYYLSFTDWLAVNS
jgi:HAD superfamily hydrolase (TIGR01509 family)